MQAQCQRCRHWQHLHPQTGRCASCDQFTANALHRFRQAFIQFCADGVLTLQEWAMLMQGLAHDHIPSQEALRFVQNDAYYFVLRVIALAAADGEIGPAEAVHIRQLTQQLQLPAHLTNAIESQIVRVEQVARIRRGELPHIAPPRGLLLESGEICHFASTSSYERVGTKRVDSTQGTLVLTGDRFFFMSAAAPHTLSWASVMSTTHQPNGVFVQSTKKTGTGLYRVDDPDLACAVIETVAKVQKRHIVIEKASRGIPQKIRSHVFQKYGGKCGECAAQEYLEFDHIIPIARGGANSLENIQLLCRRCNLAKSDRV